MILNELDRAILSELTNDPFAGNAALAEKLGVEAATITARLRILDREKISQILAVLDLDHMRQSFCCIHIQTRGRPIADIAQEIAALRTVLMVSELANGTSDLLVLLRFVDLRSLAKTLLGTIAKIPGIHRWHHDIVVEVPVFRAEYVTYAAHYTPPAVELNLAHLRKDIPEGMCDDTDLQLIAHLQQNAHQSINNIARKLDIKPSTARYRINNLKTAQILRFIRVIDPSAAGVGMFNLMEITAEVGRLDSIVESLRDRAWLPQLFKCVGKSDLICIVLSRDHEDALHIKRNEISALEGVDSVQMSQLHTSYKIDYRWAQKVA